jgi:hypothetical protein
MTMKHAGEHKSQRWEQIPGSKAEKGPKTINAQADIECSGKIQCNLKEVIEIAVGVTRH